MERKKRHNSTGATLMKNFYYTLAAILGFVNMIGIITVMYVMIN